METRTTMHIHEEAAAARADNHNLISLVRELRDETTTLLRQEVSLAKAELSEKTSQLSRNATLIGIGAVAALGAFGLLLVAATNALGIGLLSLGVSAAVTAWLSPLIIAVIVGVIGAALLAKGKAALSREGLAPQKTIETLREDKDWAKQRLNKAAA